MSKVKTALRTSCYRLKWAWDAFSDHDRLNQQIQRQLYLDYISFKNQCVTPYKKISEAGFRCYSQMEEDGIALYVLSMIGFESKKVVELCCGFGAECMATNLIINHGFEGYLFDGDPWNVEMAKAFFKSKKDCIIAPPKISRAWVTAENVNQLLESTGVTGEVDYLSLDVDGNDYWIWNALDVIKPRLCVFETHCMIPSDLSLTIPYDPHFQANVESRFYGTSLAAMVKLGRKKGYRLIGAHRYGFNVFFLRNDVAPELFPEVTMESVHACSVAANAQQQEWPRVKNLPWVSV